MFKTKQSDGAKTDFMAKERIYDTSWDVVGRDIGTDFFSFVGHAPLNRRVFINEMYGGCLIDRGWLVVPAGDACPEWDKKYQNIVLASETKLSVAWGNNDAARQDALVIYGLYESERNLPSYTSLGCFVDQAQPRALAQFAGDVGDLDECFSKARFVGANLFGMQYGRQCWIDFPTSTSATAAPAGDCSAKCGGDLPCGGGDGRVSIYKVNGAQAGYGLNDPSTINAVRARRQGENDEDWALRIWSTISGETGKGSGGHVDMINRIKGREVLPVDAFLESCKIAYHYFPDKAKKSGCPPPP
jgi:hypothetical protein